MSAANRHGQPSAEAAELLRYRHALAALGMGVWEVDMTTRMVVWDDRCRSLFGLVNERSIGYSDVLQIIHPDDRGRVDTAVQDALAGKHGGRYDESYRTQGPDGVLRHVRFTGQVEFDGEGTAIHLSGVAQDVTDWNTIQRKAEVFERTAQTALESTGAGWYRLSIADGQFEHSPELTYIMTGDASRNYSREELATYIYPSDVAIREAAYAKAEATDQLDYTVRFRWQDGSLHWVRVTGRYHRNADGEKSLFTGTAQDVSLLKNAERQFMFTDRAVAASADGIVITGADTAESPIVYVNEAFERMTGYTSEEIIGQDCRFLQADDRDQPELETLRTCLKAGQPCTIVLRNYKKDGTLFYNELSVSPVKEGDRLLHFVGIQKDVTARLQTEEALRQSERRFRSVFNGQFLFLAILAPDGRLIDINELPLKAIDGTREEVLGKPFWETPWWRDLPDMREEWPMRLAAAASARGPVFSEDRFQTSSGEVRIADASITAVKDAEGAVDFFIVQASDITERKAAEEALQQSEDRYQSFVHQSTDGIWRFELKEPIPVTLPVAEQIDGVFSNAVLAECNDAFAHMYGYEKGTELVGALIQDFMPRDEIGEAYIRHFIESGYRIAGLESREIDRDGREMFLMNNLIGIVEDGKVQRAWGTQRDITEERRRARALEESEAKFRALIEQSPVATCVWAGREMKTELVNDPMLALWGRKREEVMDKPLLDALPELEGQPFPEILSGIFDSGLPYQGGATPAQLVRNGILETFYFDFTYTPLRNASGEVYAIMNMAVDVTDQVVARRKIEASEARFRSIVEQAPMALGVLRGRDLVIETGNDTIFRVWRKDRAVIGLPIIEALPEIQGQGFLKQLQAVYDTGETLTGQATLARLEQADGTVDDAYFDFTYTSLRDETGHVTGVIVLAVEVTEQVTARKKIEESEAYFRRITDTAPVILWMTRPDFYCTYLNPRWYELTGQTEEEALGLGWLDATHPDDKERAAKIFTDANEKREPCSVLYRLRTADGSYRWAMDSGSPRFAADGTYEGMIGTVADVHEQKMAEEKISASEEQFRAFSNNLNSLAWMADAEGSIFWYNQRWYDYTGSNFEEMQGWGWGTVHHPEHIDGIVEYVKEAWLRPEPFELTFPLKRSDGQYRWFLTRAVPILDDSGTIQRWIGTNTDVHEQRLAEEALRQSEAKFRSVIETSPAGIGVFVGRDLIIESPNQALIDIIGKGWDIVGKPLREAMPELISEDQPFLRILDEVFTTGVPFETTGSQVKIFRDGVMTEGYYNFTYTPLRDETGNVYAILDIAIDVTEQVTARQAAEESEAFSRGIIQNSPVAKVVFEGEDMIIRTVNPNMLEMLGRDASIIGLPFMDAMPELRATPLLARLRQVLHSGEAYHAPGERISLARFGKPYTGYYNYSYQPLRNVAGEIYGIICAATEVTDLVTAQELVAENEQKLRSMVEGAPFPIGVYIGHELRIQLANRAIIKTWGKGEDIIGRTYPEVLPELDGTGIYEQLRGVLETGNPYHARNQRIDLVVDGVMTPRYFNYSFTPLHDAEGNVYGVMNTAADVTRLILAKEQVEKAEAAMRSAIELAELGTWEIDPITGRGGECSDRLCGWIGVKEGEDSLVAFMDAVHPDDKARVAASLQRAMELESDGYYDEEYRLVNRLNGRQRIVHAQGKAVANEEGTGAIRLSGTAQDITKERALQAELERQVAERTAELAEAARNLTRSNEELSQYAYVASHDLQEPLRKIQMFSGILEKQPGLPDSAPAVIMRIAQAAARMSGLIQSLLEFSRLLNAEPMKRPVNLDEVAKEIVNDFELLLSEKGATIHIGNLPTIDAVALQMNQLFYNLIGNALKFSKPDAPPEIRVECSIAQPQTIAEHLSAAVLPTQTYYHVTVSDNGIGFDTRYADQIFEVFKRLHTREVYPGSGIGLALCRRIVDNHGGALWADSTPGEGTIFNILLAGSRSENSLLSFESYTLPSPYHEN